MSSYSFKVAKFFLILSLFSVVIVTPSTLFPFIVGKYFLFRSSMSFALIAFLLGLVLPGDDEEKQAILNRIKKMIRTPLFIALIIFVFLFVLSGFFGVDPSYSFWANFERGEGGLQLINLFVFYFLLVTLFRNVHDWRKIVRYAIFASLLMIIYGVFALLGIRDFLGGGNIHDPGFRFNGSIGNPAYVAAYLVFSMGYVFYLFLTRSNKKLFTFGNFSLALFLIIFMTFFFLAATRGAFVGLAVAICASCMYLAYTIKRWRKWLIAAMVLFLLFVVLMVQFRHIQLIKNLPGSRIFDLSILTDTFQTRIMMWGVAWRGFLERPLFGWGPENFPQVFDRHFETRTFTPGQSFGVWFDRAHSVLFDGLAETGFLGTAAYFSIFLVFAFEIFRTSKRRGSVRTSLLAFLLAFPVAYLVQGLVLFDVLVIYINFFFFLALASYYFYFHGVEETVSSDSSLVHRR